MNEFIIVFRESLEASLIIGIIYTILAKSELKKSIKMLWLGVSTSILASFFVAFLALYLEKHMGNSSYEKLFEASFMYFAAALIWYVVFWLSKHVSNRAELEQKALSAAKASTWSIFFVAFFSVLREGFETVILLIASTKQGQSFSYFGFVLGLSLAVIIGYLVVAQGRRVNLKVFFKYTTLLLILLASGMVAYGSHEAEEYFTKSKQLSLFGVTSDKEISRPWSILKPRAELSPNNNPIFYSYNEKKKAYIHHLHDKGSVGVFLKGFFGYNSNPNYPEFLMWLASILGGLYYWQKMYGSKKKSKARLKSVGLSRV